VSSAAHEIDDPTSGQRWVFRAPEGDVVEADLYISVNGFVREHVHPTQEETFTGISGTFRLDVDGAAQTIGPGDTLVVPPGTAHGFRDALEPAHVLVTVRPALRLEQYFRTFLTLSRDGRLRMPVEGLPGPLLLVAVVMDEFRHEIAAPRIPLFVQRPALRVLALLGRLRGYRIT
jgi:quercetin dioxygenase-like cupin family protein